MEVLVDSLRKCRVAWKANPNIRESFRTSRALPSQTLSPDLSYSVVILPSQSPSFLADLWPLVTVHRREQPRFGGDAAGVGGELQRRGRLRRHTDGRKQRRYTPPLPASSPSPPLPSLPPPLIFLSPSLTDLPLSLSDLSSSLSLSVYASDHGPREWPSDGGGGLGLGPQCRAGHAGIHPQPRYNHAH